MYTKTLLPNIGSFFDDFLTKDIVNMGHELTKNFVNHLPAVNIQETEDNYNIELAAPGLTKERFNIELNKNILHISSTPKSHKEEDKNEYIRKEFNYNAFSRSFKLPEGKFDIENVKANYDNGVLKVSVAKLAKEQQKIVKKIAVN